MGISKPSPSNGGNRYPPGWREHVRIAVAESNRRRAVPMAGLFWSHVSRGDKGVVLAVGGKL
jgi:hypothetical protein